LSSQSIISIVLFAATYGIQHPHFYTCQNTGI